MKAGALGFIETRGNTSNVYALDAMLKAARVEYIDQIGIGGAYVTSVVLGDVSAALASVAAGAKEADAIGELVCQNVIPSPHERIYQMVQQRQADQDMTGLTALGIIETLGFATAMQAADTAIKSARVLLADWLKVGGGKINIIVRGDVAAVRTAVEAGVAFGNKIGKVEAHTLIPHPHEQLDIYPIGLSSKPRHSQRKDSAALGILETRGFAPLIRGADAALKEASVELVEWRQVGSGFVSFVVEGNVADVRSSIDAGLNAAQQVGQVVSHVVIPRPFDTLDFCLKRLS
ncbi:BMC domain-containing protein [candidate division KSB1 bacterium]|nr:BMC domain-containing protein [candidate division KSB1 bacterium]